MPDVVFVDARHMLLFTGATIFAKNNANEVMRIIIVPSGIDLAIIVAVPTAVSFRSMWKHRPTKATHFKFSCPETAI